jgi:Protein of unknown function (DUF3144)
VALALPGSREAKIQFHANLAGAPAYDKGEIPMSFDDLMKRADPFINLANSTVHRGTEPEDVGEAFLYACARYMAFLTANICAENGVSREAVSEEMVAGFESALRHHLAQMPMPRGAPLNPRPPAQQPAWESSAANRAFARFARAQSVLDVVLAAYLRGKGEPEAADLVTISIADDQPDMRKYLLNVYSLFEQGFIPEDVSVFVITMFVTDGLLAASTGGLVLDPAKDDEAKAEHAAAFEQLGLHKLATMMRKNPRRVEELGKAGMATLLGDATVDFNNLIEDPRRDPPAPQDPPGT